MQDSPEAPVLARLAPRPGRHPEHEAPAAGTVAPETNLDPAVKVGAQNPDTLACVSYTHIPAHEA